jgi:hypothetical protein
LAQGGGIVVRSVLAFLGISGQVVQLEEGVGRWTGKWVLWDPVLGVPVVQPLEIVSEFSQLV